MATFLLPGLGADKRIFQNIEVPGGALYAGFLPVRGNERLEDYAQRMAQHYGFQDGDSLIGLSLGGILTAELARHLKLKHAVLISSIPGRDQLPPWLRGAPTVLTGILTPPTVRAGYNVLFRLRDYTPQRQALLLDMLAKSDPNFIQWASRSVLKWTAKGKPAGVVQIHGDADMLFPLRFVQADYVIPGGTHLMILDRAEAVNKALASVLV